jgi:[ribosomal protein S5]-alanine N-acetyltransferase
LNKAPIIKGNKVLLRQPKESDLIDSLNIEENEELIRMYGGDIRNLSPKTKERAQRFINAI